MYMAHNALFFATLKRRAGRASLEGSCFFLIKIFNFYQKKTTSLQRTSSRTPFERSEKQCVVRHASSMSFYSKNTSKTMCPMCLCVSKKNHVFKIAFLLRGPFLWKLKK